MTLFQQAVIDFLNTNPKEALIEFSIDFGDTMNGEPMGSVKIDSGSPQTDLEFSSRIYDKGLEEMGMIKCMRELVNLCTQKQLQTNGISGPVTMQACEILKQKFTHQFILYDRR